MSASIWPCGEMMGRSWTCSSSERAIARTPGSAGRSRFGSDAIDIDMTSSWVEWQFASGSSERSQGRGLAQVVQVVRGAFGQRERRREILDRHPAVVAELRQRPEVLQHAALSLAQR